MLILATSISGNFEKPDFQRFVPYLNRIENVMYLHVPDRINAELFPVLMVENHSTSRKDDIFIPVREYRKKLWKPSDIENVDSLIYVMNEDDVKKAFRAVSEILGDETMYYMCYPGKVRSNGFDEYAREHTGLAGNPEELSNLLENDYGLMGLHEKASLSMRRVWKAIYDYLIIAGKPISLGESPVA